MKTITAKRMIGILEKCPEKTFIYVYSFGEKPGFHSIDAKKVSYEMMEECGTERNGIVIYL